MNWHKKAFGIFLICGILITCLGIYLEIMDEKTVFPNTESWTQYYSVNGWQIILMGSIIVIPGIFLLRKALREKDE